MNFEPAVIRSIKHYKRRAFIRSALAFIPLLTGISLLAALIIWASARYWDQIEKEMNSYLGTFVVIGIAVLLGYVILRSLDYNRFKKWYASYRITDFDASRLSVFSDSLDAVSIGADVNPPVLEVFSSLSLFKLCNMDSEAIVSSDGSLKAYETLPTFHFTGTRAFRLPWYTSIVITEDMAKASFSRQEVEAVMANELSHVIIGDVSKPPSVMSTRGLFAIMLFTFIALSLTAMCILYEVMGEGHALEWVVGLSAFLLVTVGYAFLWVNYLGRSISARRKRELLCDSLAAKLTGDPEASTSAINKMDRINCKFFGIPTERVNKKRSWWKRTYFDDYKDLIDERLKNLDTIALGNWPVFSQFEEDG